MHPEGVAEQLELVTEGWGPGTLVLQHLHDAETVHRARVELEGYLRDRAGIDPLTGLDSQRRFEARLDQELKRAARSGYATSVVVFELHNVDAMDLEDASLTMLRAASILQAELRDIDTVARLDGARFAALLPMCDSRSATGAASRALRVLTGIAQIAPGAGVASTDASNGWELLDAATMAAQRPGVGAPPAAARLSAAG